MKLFSKGKDGGPLSTVVGYWLIESKKLFSVVLLSFRGLSRTCYHSHAFDCWNIVLKGSLVEHLTSGEVVRYSPSIKPFKISKDRFHKVHSTGITWVISLRGPWKDTWQEFSDGELRVLTHGRKVVSCDKA